MSNDRLFISYSRRNRAFAERLARDLSDAGLDVWIDFRQIHGGEMWEQEIYRGIERSDIVIVCLSPSAVSSEWVQREVNTAKEQEKFIIPVLIKSGAMEMLEESEPMNWLLRIQYVDFVDSYSEAFAELLRALPGKRRIGPYDSVSAENIPNPFKGLEAFQQTDAPFFFGRETLIDKSLERLREDRDVRFLAVVGASGSGKSSLVRAGVIPSLRAGKLKGSEHWRIAIMSPGERPLTALANRLSPLMENSDAGAIDSMLHETSDYFDVLTNYALQDAPEEARLVVVIDQFEEVFTRASQEEAERFLEVVYRAVSVPEGRAHVLITMRADFFDRLSNYPELAALFEQENMVIVTEMTPPELLRSIEGPAQAVGLVYDTGLPQRLLEEVRRQPGSLPLLQYCLKELFLRREGRRLTMDAYEEIGGVQQALAQHAETIYSSLDSAQQAIMRRLLLRLVEVSESGEATRRRVVRDELTFRDVPDNAVQDVIEMLSSPDTRLLIVSRQITGKDNQSAPETYVEISHEALIREWERFTDWVAENVENLRLGSEILQSAQDWQGSNRDKAYLLTGNRLTRAEAWLEEADATPLQREFIQASLDEAERREKLRQAQIERELELQRKANVRQRRFILLLGVLFVVAVLLSALAFVSLQRAERQTELAQQRQREAQEAQDRAEESAREALSLALSASANRAFGDREFDLAAMLSVYANQGDDPPPQSQQMLADVVYAPGTQHLLNAEGRVINQGAISPDGTLAAAATSDTILLWNAETGEQLESLGGGDDVGHEGPIHTLTFSPDGRYLASGGADGTIIFWDVETREPSQTLLGMDSPVRAIAFSPNDALLMGGSEDGRVLVWRWTDGSIFSESRRHNETINDVAFSGDGQYFAAASSDGQVSVYATRSGHLLNLGEPDEPPHGGPVYSVAFNPSGPNPRILTGGVDGEIIEWRFLQDEFISRRFEAHQTAVHALHFHPDGSSFFSSDTDGAIIWWDETEGEPITQFEDHDDFVGVLDTDSSGTRLYSGSRDGTARVWSLEDVAIMREINAHDRFQPVVAEYSSDGKRILSGSESGSVRLWDATNGYTLQQFTMPSQDGSRVDVNAVALDPDSETALAGGDDGRLVQWQVETGESQVMNGHEGEVNVVAYVPGKAQAVSGGEDGALILWDLETGTELAQFGPKVGKDDVGHTDAVNDLTVHPSGRYVFSASDDGSLILWDLEGDGLVNTYKGHNSAVESVAFDESGQRAVSGGENGSIIVWSFGEDVTARDPLDALQRQIETLDDSVTDIAFSPIEDYILTVSEDRTLRMWDAATGFEVRRFTAPDGRSFNSLDLDPRGQTVLTGMSRGGSFKEWRLLAMPEDLLSWLETFRYVRQPDCQERRQFQIDPQCEGGQQPPTATPYPTLTLSPMPAMPQVQVGGRAVVNMVTDETLNVRSEARITDDNIIDQLEDGTVVTVQDGPVEADGFTWWQIETEGGQVGWSAGFLPDESVQTLVPLSEY